MCFIRVETPSIGDFKTKSAILGPETTFIRVLITRFLVQNIAKHVLYRNF